jgi:hypothetical protein
MSAGKRTGLRPIQKEAPSFRQNVLTYLGAQDAFAKIKTSKLNQDLVWGLLWDLACREEESRLPANQWYVMKGLPLHTMRRFPNRVRDWAKEIEMVSGGIQSAYGYSPILLPAIIESQMEGRRKAVPLALAQVDDALCTTGIRSVQRDDDQLLD